ncbi:hypothetical protein K4K54_005310 [Colletotrichum sp. SAR 10_86]|nr:hypothetical protein K4K54_005310 [Colletotrichum sp. SAR 10_86]
MFADARAVGTTVEALFSKLIENREKDEKAKHQHYLVQEIQPREIVQAKKQLSEATQAMASSSKNAGSQPGQKPAAVANTKVAHEAQSSGPLAQQSPSSMSSRAAGVGISDAKATLKGGGDPEDEAAASLHSVGSQAVQEVQRQTLHERPSTTAARGHIAEDSGLGGMDETGHDGMGGFNSNDGLDDDGNEYDAGNEMGNDPVEDDDISAEKAGVASAKKHVLAQSDGSLASSSEYQDCDAIEERSGLLDKEVQ